MTKKRHKKKANLNQIGIQDPNCKGCLLSNLIRGDQLIFFLIPPLKWVICVTCHIWWLVSWRTRSLTCDHCPSRSRCTRDDPLWERAFPLCALDFHFIPRGTDGGRGRRLAGAITAPSAQKYLDASVYFFGLFCSGFEFAVIRPVLISNTFCCRLPD